MSIHGDPVSVPYGKAANATINRELAIIRRAYNLGALEDPPLIYRVPRIPKLKEDNIREGFLESREYRMILDSLPEPLKPAFVLGYHLGMRTGELLALKRDWVDLRRADLCQWTRDKKSQGQDSTDIRRYARLARNAPHALQATGAS